VAGPFDLSRFAPNPYFHFKLRSGAEYRCFADPDVDQVARMLRIESVLNGSEDGDVGEHLKEGKEILADLIRQATPDADLAGFRIGSQEIAVVFAALLHGESVATAVLEAISRDDRDEPAEPGTDDPDALQQDDETGFTAKEGGEVTPLPSARRSAEPSSASDEPAGSLPATGTA
jgi:hypothetical protein